MGVLFFKNVILGLLPIRYMWIYYSDCEPIDATENAF
jgi:hypothetical protein